MYNLIELIYGARVEDWPPVTPVTSCLRKRARAGRKMQGLEGKELEEAYREVLATFDDIELLLHTVHADITHLDLLDGMTPLYDYLVYCIKHGAPDPDAVLDPIQRQNVIEGLVEHMWEKGEKVEKK